MSDFFEWDAKYNLGVPHMDNEHRVIVETMNQLHVLHESGAPAAKITKVMSLLMQVTKSHFADEEAYMEKIGYPGLRKHRHMHLHLLDRMGEFQAKMQGTGTAPPELFDFLKMWLKAHICGIDTQYASHSQAA